MVTWACIAESKQSFELGFDIEKAVQTDFANESQISNAHARGIFSRGNAAGLTKTFEEGDEGSPYECVKRKAALIDVTPINKLI